MKGVALIAASCAFLLSAPTTTAFAPSTTGSRHVTRPSPSALAMSEDGKSTKNKVDTNLRSKLLTESIAPWRTLRLFLYGALGSGAFLGGLVNGSGAIAASASPEFNLNTELLNIGIDFGAVALFAFLFKYDLDKQGELSGKVDEKLERKKKLKETKKTQKQRESLMASLPLEILVSPADGATRTVIVGELQAGARQHIILVAGPKSACRDALLGANLLKLDFVMSNILVVPYQTDRTELEARPKSGFGDQPSYETQPYVARAPHEEWQDFIDQEMNDAVEQNGESVKKDGIVLVIANNGKIIRRGIGTIPWRQMVDELDAAVAA